MECADILPLKQIALQRKIDSMKKRLSDLQDCVTDLVLDLEALEKEVQNKGFWNK